MATVGTIRIGMQADTKELERGMKRATGSVESFTIRLKTGGRGVFEFFAGLDFLGRAAGRVASALASTVVASADLAEAADLVRVQYESAADIVIAKSDEMAERFGTNKTKFLENVGTLQGLLGTMNKTSEATAEMGNRLGALAIDMESAFNSDFALELERIRAGLAGEAEPLRRYGVDVSAAAVAQEAYRSGIAEVGKELTNAQKIQGRYNIILNDLSKIEGNKELTKNSTANRLKEIDGRVENLKGTLGSGVDIIAKALLGTLAEGFLNTAVGVEATTDDTKTWAKESIQAGGFISNALGGVGTSIAWLLDGFSFLQDSTTAFATTIGEVLASNIAAGLWAVGTLLKGLELLTGRDWGSETLNSLQVSAETMAASFADTRDDLFNGSEWAASIREGVKSTQDKLDEIGRSADATIATTAAAAKDTIEQVATAGKATKLELSDAFEFGSSEALSVLSRAASGGAKDREPIRVAQDQLTVQRQSLIVSGRIADGIASLLQDEVRI